MLVNTKAGRHGIRVSFGHRGAPRQFHAEALYDVGIDSLGLSSQPWILLGSCKSRKHP